MVASDGFFELKSEDIALLEQIIDKHEAVDFIKKEDEKLFVYLNRITSYNVCYTKLLRNAPVSFIEIYIKVFMNSLLSF